MREMGKEEALEYTQLYKRTLNAMWLEPLSDQDERMKVEVERVVKLEELEKCRAYAIAELKHELGGKKVTLRDEEKVLLLLNSSIATTNLTDNT